MRKTRYTVYILYCSNNTFYTGYTSDLKRRYQEHCNGSPKCKYTRTFKPIKIARAWQVDYDKALAMQIEYYIKNLTRAEKEILIAKPSRLKTVFKCKPLAKAMLPI